MYPAPLSILLVLYELHLFLPVRDLLRLQKTEMQVPGLFSCNVHSTPLSGILLFR